MVEYHSQKGDLQNPIVSHSLLNLLDPEIGGHPTKVKNAILNNIQLDSKSLETGTLLHDWMEREGSFAIEELDKPSGQMATFAEVFYELYFLEKWKEDLDFIPKISASLILQLEEQFQIHKIYSDLFNAKADSDQFNLFGRLILYARAKAEVNKQLTIPKVLEKFEKECLPYIAFLKENTGKIILDKATKNILINCKQSINNHPFAATLRDTCNLKEVELFWQEEISEITLNRKAKVDRMFVDLENKVLTIVDFKTTSKPISDFDNEWGAYFKYKLGRQLENYAQGYFKSQGITDEKWTVNLYNIVVQTNDTFPCAVYKTDYGDFEFDLTEILFRMVKHIKLGIWDITLPEIENGFIQI